LHQTAGGWEYSLRVLLPLIALMAVAGGLRLGQLGNRSYVGVICGLGLLSLDAARRSLFLPVDPLPSPVRVYSDEWKEFGAIGHKIAAHPGWDFLSRQPGGIVVDHPLFHAFLASRKARAIPFTSPEIAFLFEKNGSFNRQLERLRSSGIRYVLIARRFSLAERIMEENPFFKELRHHKPIGSIASEEIFDLNALGQ
jgi:hypothetical protein